MNMERCIILQCSTKLEKKGVGPHAVLHEFPAASSKIKLWLQQTGQHFEDLDSFALRIEHAKSERTFLMCSAHFSEDSYVLHGSERVLKDDALPTIFPESNGAPLIKEMGSSEAVQLLQWPSPNDCWDAGTSTAHGVLRRDACTQTEAVCFYMDDSTWSTPISLATKSHLEGSEKDKTRTKIKHHFKTPLFSVAHVSSEEDAIPGKVQDATLPEDPTISVEMSEVHCSEQAVKKEMDYVNERKFLVFESCLDALFLKAICGAQIGCIHPVEKLIKKVEGSLLSVMAFCSLGHGFLLWESQPRLKSVAVGNILSAAAILCSGSSFSKVHEMNSILGVQQISHSTYRSYRRRYLYAVIDHHWQMERKQLKEERQGKPLRVACDAQHNAPLKSSKYCVNTVMTMQTNEILDFETVLPTQHAFSSAQMEKEALEICLERMQQENYELHVVATDRHEGIRELMREKYSTLRHQYDIWHYTQSLKKRLLMLSKKKSGADICLWIDALMYHFRWTIKSSGGNENLVFEKWASLLNHITDQHSWKNADFYHECAHEELLPSEREAVAWLKRNSTTYDHLYNFVTDEQLKEDLVLLVPYCDSLGFEMSRSLMQKYKPKGIHLQTDSVEARTQLGILTHNFNMRHNRAIVRGSRKFSDSTAKKAIVDERKFQKRWVIQHKHLPLSIAHLEGLMNDVLRKCSGSLHIPWRRRHTVSGTFDFGLLSKPECTSTPGLQ